MGLGVLRIGFPGHHQTVRIVIGKRTKENGVDDGKNRGVRADAEGESENGDGGEAGAALQHAKRVAKIAGGHVQPADDVGVASVFLEEGGVAEALLRFVARGFGGHADGEVVGGAHLDMRTQLFVEVTIQAFPS